MTTFNINDYEIVNSPKNMIFENLALTNKIVKFYNEDEFKINNMNILGVKDDFYFFDYPISRNCDMINNIQINNCSYFELVLNGMEHKMPEKYDLYMLLLLYMEVKIRIYFNKNEYTTIDQFKISYNGYLFPSNSLRINLARKNGQRDYLNCFDEVLL